MSLGSGGRGMEGDLEGRAEGKGAKDRRQMNLKASWAVTAFYEARHHNVHCFAEHAQRFIAKCYDPCEVKD